MEELSSWGKGTSSTLAGVTWRLSWSLLSRSIRIRGRAHGAGETDRGQSYGSVFCFNAMRKTMKDKNIALKIRKELYLALVVNIALWGCDSWALSATNRKKLATWHMYNVRSILNVIRWHCREYKESNAVHLRRLDILQMEKMIEIRQLRFLKKVAQMPTNRLTRQAICSQAHAGEDDKLSRGATITTRSTHRNSIFHPVRTRTHIHPRPGSNIPKNGPGVAIRIAAPTTGVTVL